MIENLIDEMMHTKERLSQYLLVMKNDLDDLGQTHVDSLENRIKQLERKIEWQEMIENVNNNYAMFS